MYCSLVGLVCVDAIVIYSVAVCFCVLRRKCFVAGVCLWSELSICLSELRNGFEGALFLSRLMLPHI